MDEAVEEAVPAGKPTYFPPLRIADRKVQIRPLLTPDNYQKHVLALIETAERRLLFQNQSLSLLGLDRNGEDKNDERFAALADALLVKQQAGVDVRIIMRGEFAPVGPLEQLQRRGFDMRKVRLQNRCHTKGIIVDGERVLVGSHNWTNQGTLVNRDARRRVREGNWKGNLCEQCKTGIVGMSGCTPRFQKHLKTCTSCTPRTGDAASASDKDPEPLTLADGTWGTNSARLGP